MVECCLPMGLSLRLAALVSVTAAAAALATVLYLYKKDKEAARRHAAGATAAAAASPRTNKRLRILEELLPAAKSVEARLTELSEKPEPAPIKEVLEAFGPVSKMQDRMNELHGLTAATKLVSESDQTVAEIQANKELENSMQVVKQKFKQCIERLPKSPKAQ